MARPRADKSSWYVYPEDLKRELELSKQAGQMTEKFAVYLMTIHNKVTSMPRFKNYPMEVKEEIVSWSLHKFIKNESWKRMDPDKGSLFAYITTAAFRNMLTALGNYYRYFNRKMDIVKNTIEELRQYFQNLKCIPRGWEEAVQEYESWIAGHPTLQDDEDVVEQVRQGEKE